MARSAWRSTRRGLFLTQRAMGDLSAFSRGRGTRRVVRRRVVRSVWRAFR